MSDLFVKGGFLMYPILFCSIMGVAIWINKFLQFRKMMKDLEFSIQHPKNEKAIPSLSQPLIEGLRNHMDEKELSVSGTRQVRMIEKGLSWLGLIATITPLLGLTGTVTGMIKAFMVIEKSPNVNPSMLAGGIWEALITTAAGLLVAIPIHIGHHYLEKQADEIALMMKERVTQFQIEMQEGLRGV